MGNVRRGELELLGIVANSRLAEKVRREAIFELKQMQTGTKSVVDECEAIALDGAAATMGCTYKNVPDYSYASSSNTPDMFVLQNPQLFVFLSDNDSNAYWSAAQRQYRQLNDFKVKFEKGSGFKINCSIDKLPGSEDFGFVCEKAQEPKKPAPKDWGQGAMPGRRY